MARGGANRMPSAGKRRYFELIRQGLSGAEAARRVGVSLSCGSLWFIDAGSVDFIDAPVSARFLSQADRIDIADGLACGDSVRVIAARIGKSFQSVYREIARNRKADSRYQPWYAHGQAKLRRKRPRRSRFDADERLRAVVAGRLEVKWSPAQISRWLRRRWPARNLWHVCPETIYQAVYSGAVAPAVDPRLTLRSGRTYRHKRGRGRSREGALKQCTNLKSIHDRPVVVERRVQVGHWEGDLIIGAGQRSAIATLVERRTRHTILVPVRGGRTAAIVGDALIAAFTRLPRPLRRTLTWDQGNEMFQHARIQQETGLDIYFADPHSPWQRGSNENANGLLRQYFPKGTDLDTYTDEQIQAAAAELNERPRACLNDHTPARLTRRWLSNTS